MTGDMTELRVTVISDTHMLHDTLALPPGDLLIHYGDMFDLYALDTSLLRRMDVWFGAQPFDKIVCTGGNHDHLLDHVRGLMVQPFGNAYFLQDELIHYRGLSLYGAPWVPALPTHAFHKERWELANAWADIPAGLDILITHTPPKDVLDRSSRDRSYGCPELARQLERVRPRVHCFGHVHASAGQLERDGTLFVNAASMLSGQTALREPISLRLAPRTQW